MGNNFQRCTPASTPNPQVLPTNTWGLKGKSSSRCKTTVGRQEAQRNIYLRLLVYRTKTSMTALFCKRTFTKKQNPCAETRAHHKRALLKNLKLKTLNKRCDTSKEGKGLEMRERGAQGRAGIQMTNVKCQYARSSLRQDEHRCDRAIISAPALRGHSSSLAHLPPPRNVSSSFKVLQVNSAFLFLVSKQFVQVSCTQKYQH